MSDTPSHVRLAVSRADVVVLGLLALSLCGNVALGVAFVRLGGVPNTASAASDQAVLSPQIGDRVPVLRAERFQTGTREEVSFNSDSRPTLLYIFTPDCSWCAKNLQSFKEVIAAAQQTHRVIGLSLDSEVRDYLRKAGLDLPVYVKPDAASRDAYHLGATPVTLVISPAGSVVKAWVGAYKGPSKKEVEQYFGVTLSGPTAQVSVAKEGL